MPTIKERHLTEEAEIERMEFERDEDWRGCTCFLAPPCGYCTHPGNPINQHEDETCWVETEREMTEAELLEGSW